MGLNSNDELGLNQVIREWLQLKKNQKLFCMILKVIFVKIVFFFSCKILIFIPLIYPLTYSYKNFSRTLRTKVVNIRLFYDENIPNYDTVN